MVKMLQRYGEKFDELFPPYSDRRFWVGVVFGVSLLALLMSGFVALVEAGTSRTPEEQRARLEACRTFCAQSSAHFAFDKANEHCVCQSVRP